MLMLAQVYGDNAVNKTAVCKWVKRFSEGRESVTEEESSELPATNRTEENIVNIGQIVRENRRLTLRSIAEQLHIRSIGSASVTHGLWTEVKDRVEYREEGSRKVCRNVVGTRGGRRLFSGEYREVGDSPFGPSS